MDTSVEMVDCQNLTPGSLLDVETKTRHYKIECLGGNKIRISGHPEFSRKHYFVAAHAITIGKLGGRQEFVESR